MNEENNNVMEYATHRYAPESTATTETETVIVTETTPENTSQASDTTVIVEENTTTEQTNTPVVETPTIDYGKFLSENSEGLFSDLESFKSAIPKVKEYDNLVKSKEELEEKLKVDPFANEFSKTLDSMIRGGKTADEIDNFVKISRTDIDTLSDEEVKVMALVNKGYSLDIAKAKVGKDFPMDDYDDGSTDKAILQEELRISALEDRKALKEYKKELTAIDNSAQVEANNKAEEARLAGIAKLEAHNTSVKQNAPKIAEKISGLGEVNLNGKEGDEAQKLNFDYPEEFKALLPQKLEAFFIDGQMEMTDENIAYAQKYIKADYLEQNFEKLSQDIFKHAYSLGAESTVNKFENRTGLAPETQNPNVDNTDQARIDFMNKIATSR